MPFRIKISLIALAFLLALVFVVPLVVPIPPAPNTQPLATLAAGADYLTVDGVDLHYLRYQPGDAQGPTFLLLHDYAFNAHSFDRLGPDLAQAGQAVAFDRPGFGLSQRPLPTGGKYPDGFNPYTPAAQVDLTLGVLDALGVHKAVLIGNGMGGRVALDVALAKPERVQGLILLDAPAFLQQGRQAPSWLLDSPQMQRVGPVFLRQLAEGPGQQLLLNAFADDSQVSQQIRDQHALTTSVDDWDQALWQISRAGQPPSLEGRLGLVTAPTLVVTGGGQVDAAEDALQLSQQIPGAQLVTLPECGRVPQLECPDALLGAVNDWLASTDLSANR